MCLVNFTHGYLLYTPNAQVQLEVKAVTNFIDTKLWEQASFKYSLNAGTPPSSRPLSALHLEPQAALRLPRVRVDRPRLAGKPAPTQLKSRTIASDWILETPADKSRLKELWSISANETRMDYLVRDVHHGLRGNNVTISLNVEYMPIAGIFFNVAQPLPSPACSRPPTPCPRSTATPTSDTSTYCKVYHQSLSLAVQAATTHNHQTPNSLDVLLSSSTGLSRSSHTFGSSH